MGAPAPDGSARERAERRQHWLEGVERELWAANAWEAERKPEALLAHLDRMLEVLDRSDALTPADKLDFRNRVRGVEAKAYQRHIDFLLEQAMVVTRDKTRQTERGGLFRALNEALNVVPRLGFSDAIKQDIKARLDIIMQTSAAGDSTAAKEAADREAALIEAPAHPRERRTFTRWHTPPLIVTIAGRAFTAKDWSLGGALLEDVGDHGWKPGQPIDVQIRVADGTPHTERLEVARYVPEWHKLAVKSRRFGSAFVQVKRDSDAAGLELV